MKKYIFILLFGFGVSNLLCKKELMYFCTGGNRTYYPHLINLIGSIHQHNYDELGEIAVYDLGLMHSQIEHLKSMDKVVVLRPNRLRHSWAFSLHKHPNEIWVLGWYAWKSVIIKQALERYPYVLYMDAGTTVCSPLDHVFSYLRDTGYVLYTSGDDKDSNGEYLHPVSWGMTTFVREAFADTLEKHPEILKAETIMGGVLGASRGTKIFEQMYDLLSDVRYFADDGSSTIGFGGGRHDQVLLSILAYSQGLKVLKQDYTQKVPIKLTVGEHTYENNVTWNPDYLDGSTDIYSSRWDFRWYYELERVIRYRD